MRLILGPPGSGKTRLCLDRMRAALRVNREDCRLLVPTATMAEHLRNELAREGFVFRPALVTTFTKFVEPFTAGLAGIPSGGLEIIVAETLAKLPLTRYAGVSEFPGFRASVVHAIQEFSAAGGCLEDLQNSAAEPDFIRVFQATLEELRRRNLHLRSTQLARAAEVIRTRGGRVAEGVEFYLAPASAEVQAKSESNGDWKTLLDAGAIPLPPGCGACIGLGRGLVEKGEIAISATNRNFKGRMGDRDALVYLGSPAVVAASVTVWIVLGRWPTSENICCRVSTSLTGRPTARAASAASATCDHGVPLQPNPPPT